MSFTLLEFQERAVDAMRAALAAWIKAVEDLGRPPSTVDGDPIPLIAHLTAITGAGKTPMLAKVIGGLGPAVVLWTTNRSVVVDQTVKKLNDDYRHFLPDKTTVIGEEPSPSEWASLIEDTDGLFIWCRSVASWNAPNEAAKGTEQARLNIHRPASDRAGGRSPWEQLATLEARPLWIVYDESHGQTDVQLDQLLELNPVGVLAASGTPSFSAKISEFETILESSPIFGPIADAAMIEVPTRAVAAAGLLKSTIEMDDLNADDASRVTAAVDKMVEIARAANESQIPLNPRAIFITEESNRKDREPRPVVLWNLLTQRCGVPPSRIAVATSTRELPKEAERVTSLDQLRDRHQFLIFNKKFQEGWDDPEAYVAYFDGQTKSAQRIKQIIGRIIRQPNARPFEGLADLNTAFIFVSSPDTKFAGIVENIRKHLVEEYGADQEGRPNVIARARSDRPAIVPLRAGLPDLSLPVLTLVAPNLDPLFEHIAREGQREYPPEQRDAPGSVTRRSFRLTDNQKKIVAHLEAIGQHTRSRNGDYFLDRVRTLSRRAFDALPDATVTGPLFEQDSATLSPAQEGLRQLAGQYVKDFEERVTYGREPDPKHLRWSPMPFSPTRAATLAFTRSVHPAYPEGRSFLNDDEREMCEALDATGAGWWMRNPPSAGSGGYGIPLPVKVVDSETFYPDFLWWVDETCWAIDTTGIHILPGKVRGKLLDIDLPKIVLAVRDQVGPSLDTLEDKKGWSLILPGPSGPRRLLYNDLGTLLVELNTPHAAGGGGSEPF